MFSGIVLGIGCVSRVMPKEGSLSVLVLLDLSRTFFPYSSVQPGSSISVSGVCLTVVSIEQGENFGYWFDLSDETLSCTTGLNVEGSLVNLEPSLQLNSSIDGHFVSGHVDDVASVFSCRDLGDCSSIVFSASQTLMPYIVRKGSIAVDGISLTVNTVEDSSDAVLFGVNLIPYTLSHTNAASFQPSKKVNLEVDMLSRYVVRCTKIFLNERMSGSF